MAKTSVTMNVQAEGVDETLAAFRRLPKEASKALRERSKALAQVLAARAKTAAVSAPTPQAALVAGTVRVKSDRLPAIQAGGSSPVGRHGVPAWKVLFGSEFGSNRYSQFGHSHTGQSGLWLFPTVEREQAAQIKAWGQVADDIVRAFTTGRGL